MLHQNSNLNCKQQLLKPHILSTKRDTLCTKNSCGNALHRLCDKQRPRIGLLKSSVVYFLFVGKLSDDERVILCKIKRFLNYLFITTKCQAGCVSNVREQQLPFRILLLSLFGPKLWEEKQWPLLTHANGSRQFREREKVKMYQFLFDIFGKQWSESFVLFKICFQNLEHFVVWWKFHYGILANTKEHSVLNTG